MLMSITDIIKIEKLKLQYMTMVAHELKTPLAAVLGYSDILYNSTLEISKDKRMEYNQRSENRLKASNKNRIFQQFFRVKNKNIREISVT